MKKRTQKKKKHLGGVFEFPSAKLNSDLNEIYEKYYKIQRSSTPLKLALQTKLKADIKAKFPQYTSTEVANAVTEINKQLNTSIKEAEDSEAKEMTLDPDIAAHVQDYYNDLKTKNPVPQGASAEDIANLKLNINSKAQKHLVDKHEVKHPGLQRRYISELKDEKLIVVTKVTPANFP